MRLGLPPQAPTVDFDARWDGADEGRAWRGMLGPVRWPVAGNRAELISARQGPRGEVRREDTTAIRFARAQAVIGAATKDVGVALERGAARDEVGGPCLTRPLLAMSVGAAVAPRLAGKAKAPATTVGRHSWLRQRSRHGPSGGEACFNQAQELYTTGGEASRSRAPEFVQSPRHRGSRRAKAQALLGRATG